MKITIEGEPKEIAALELALKDGSNNTVIINQPKNDGSADPYEQAIERVRGAKISKHGGYKAIIT